MRSSIFSRRLLGLDWLFARDWRTFLALDWRTLFARGWRTLFAQKLHVESDRTNRSYFVRHLGLDDSRRFWCEFVLLGLRFEYSVE